MSKKKKKEKKGGEASAPGERVEVKVVGGTADAADAEADVAPGDLDPDADAPTDAAAPADATPPTLEERLDAAELEATEQAGKALRTLAEFDNYRRRILRDLSQAEDRGAAEVLGELLGVVDNFDRALEHAGDDAPDSFLEGMRLVARGLHDLLDRRGVARIEAIGTPFDPEFHEALTSLPSDEAEPNTVLQEVQTGWRFGDRVLRPTKVVVSRAAETGKDS